MRRKWWAIGAGAILLLIQGVGLASVKAPPAEFSSETKECVACHKKNNPGIVQQWGDSKHYRAKVGCYECHAAEEGDVDAYIDAVKTVTKHIATFVSPQDCSGFLV